jgi:catechol 2,3-dioxygenase-like lactoylglutathione lyase family enzyme
MLTFSSPGEANMQAGRHINGIEFLDHPVIAARDLDAARVTWERLGFTIPPRGSHIEWGTGNLCIMFPDDYLEVRGIVDASRFTMNLDKHLDQFGEGLMGVAFRTDNVQTSYREMVDHGMRVAEPRRLTRNFEHPEGWTQPSFELCVPEPDDIEGLMHVVVLQHLTPKLIRRPDFLSHQNACVGVNAMAGIIHDAERVAAKLALLLGDDSVQTNADRVHLVVPTGQQIDLLLPHVYQARFGDIGRESDSKTPRLGAMTLRVEDLGRTQDVLAGNDVAFGNPDEGTIRVGPEYACGVVLDFTEKSAR